MTAVGEQMTTVRLAGAIVQGAALDTGPAGQRVTVPREKIDRDDLVFRVACADLVAFGIEEGDLLIVEPRPEGDAATAELVLAMLDGRAYVGRWWRKQSRRALLNHGLVPIAEDPALWVTGAVTVVVRERRSDPSEVAQ